jgi:hypothetical protein
MYPEMRIFTFCKDPKVMFYNHIQNRKYFRLGPDFSDYETLIDLSEKFNDTNEQAESKLIFNKFEEELNKVDQNKFIELIGEYNMLRRKDNDRIRSDIKFFCNQLNMEQLTEYKHPIFFHATLSDIIDFDYKKLSVDMYNDYFHWGLHAFFVCYYPTNNTFYVIDPDENNKVIDSIISCAMKFLCKNLEFKPLYRIVKGVKVQQLTKDMYCTLHSLDLMRQISENPTILDLDDKKMCAYFLKDYKTNGKFNIDKLYSKYVNRYCR